MRCSAIVVAGGSGRRFGGHKQFMSLAGVSVAARSVTACRSVADEVILVVPADAELSDHGADRVVIGGATRSQSVRAGLIAVDPNAEVVVVHDAARPLASERLFLAVVAELADAALDGAIPGLAITDTIKRVIDVEGRRRAIETLDRSELVAVQTPQAFRRSALVAAHAGTPEATDDGALVEALGGAVVVVPGESENLKITSPGDLLLASQMMEGRA